ncbi:MAG TPA: hypothetical protein VKR58_05895 [Aquella sp.]|nr:hypothetical protein [Aquella sp.]
MISIPTTMNENLTDVESRVELSQTEKEEAWFNAMRNYFLGFLPTDQMEKIYNEINFIPEDKEGFYKRISKELEPLYSQEEVLINQSLPLTIEGFVPPQKKFFYSWDIFKKFNLAPWVKKSMPDNCLIKRFKDDYTTYDVRCFEECGFVEIGDWLISRTVQPYAIVADVPFKNEDGTKGVKEEVQAIYPSLNSKTGLLCVIPKMTEEEFFTKCPFVPGADNMGIQFTGEFEVGMINPEFAAEYNIPCTTAFILRRYKSKLKMNKNVSKPTVERDFYRGAMVG